MNNIFTIVDENVSGGKKPSLAKTKEAWTSSDCMETSPATHKPKHRRKLSRKRRTTKETKLVTMGNNSSAATWSVSSTSQWRCPALTLVANTTDLQQLARFFYRKVRGHLIRVLHIHTYIHTYTHTHTPHTHIHTQYIHTHTHHTHTRTRTRKRTHPHPHAHTLF